MSLHDWTCPPQSPLEKQIYLATFFHGSALNTKQKCSLQNRIRAELCICDRLASHILHSTASHAILLLEEVIGGGSKRSKSKLPTSSFCPFHDRFLSDLAMMLLWTSQRPNVSAQQTQTSQLLTYLCDISKYLLRGAHLSYLKVRQYSLRHNSQSLSSFHFP